MFTMVQAVISGKEERDMLLRSDTVYKDDGYKLIKEIPAKELREFVPGIDAFLPRLVRS